MGVFAFEGALKFVVYPEDDRCQSSCLHQFYSQTDRNSECSFEEDVHTRQAQKDPYLEHLYLHQLQDKGFYHHEDAFL